MGRKEAIFSSKGSPAFFEPASDLFGFFGTYLNTMYLSHERTIDATHSDGKYKQLDFAEEMV